MESGTHTAELKVWDVYNNSTTQTFTFEVVEDLKPLADQIDSFIELDEYDFTNNLDAINMYKNDLDNTKFKDKIIEALKEE